MQTRYYSKRLRKRRKDICSFLFVRSLSSLCTCRTDIDIATVAWIRSWETRFFLALRKRKISELQNASSQLLAVHSGFTAGRDFMVKKTFKILCIESSQGMESFMEPEVALPCSNPTTRPCPEPDYPAHALWPYYFRLQD